MPRAIPIRLLTALICAGCAALAPGAALAAARHPRLEEANLGKQGQLLLEYGQDAYDETSALASGRDVATFFNFGYNVNERLQLRARLLRNELAGTEVLFNPLLSNLTGADGWGVEFRALLERTEPVYPATPEDKFTPGNAFTVALGFTSLALEAPAVDEDLHRFFGALYYSTDFTPELHAHTMFGTEHYTSETKRGNATSLGLGVDYDLYSWDSGRSALQLTANGLIDIYSLRKPSFDTGRVTRFDAGLRVRVTDTLSAYAGYQVVNDSLSDRNSQGPFYGVSYTPVIWRPSRAGPEQPAGAAEEGVPAPPPAEAATGETAPQDALAEPAPADAPDAAGDSTGAGKEAASLPSASGLGSGVPPVEIRGGSRPAPMPQTPASGSSPQPTTSARIARPPAVENPWELLPLGLDFHPVTATMQEGVAGAAAEAAEPLVATEDSSGAETVTGEYRIFSNL